MERAFTGFGDFGAGQGDTSRMQFVTKQLLNRMATATLVKVKAVGDGTVDIQPMIAQLDGAGNSLPHGTIHNVPWFAHRAGASAVLMEPVVGDIGLAVFCHNDISAVKRSKEAATPGSRRRFDWADALYLGGFLGDEPTQFIRLDTDGISIQAADGKPVQIASTDKVDVTGVVETDTEYRVAGMKVVGEQQGAITAPSGGGTVDAQGRTAIASIIAALQAHGLIA